MPKIKEVRAREILDSRGNPTLEADVILDSGIVGRAAVPSGASTGEREALELRDQDPKRFQGKGVLKAVGNVRNVIAPKIKGLDIDHQEKLDRLMIKLDGTENKSKLGANAMLGVSLAAARARAATRGVPLFQSLEAGTTLPCPFMNVINGGAHADNTLDFQEFMIVPGGFTSFSRAIQAGCEIFHTLKSLLKKKGYTTSVGDEGGFAPNLKSHEEALELILAAIDGAGYTSGKDVALALDTASSEFYEPADASPQRDPERALTAALAKYDLVTESQLHSATRESQQSGRPLEKALVALGYVTAQDLKRALSERQEGKYRFKKSDRTVRTSQQMVDLFERLAAKYPIVSIEDGLAEDDWEGWALLTRKMGKSTQLVGDDLFVTNPAILREGIKKKIANSILIKVNQIGTLTETIEAIRMAKKARYTAMVSHRSGETEDTIIAHLAVAFDTGMIKTGSASRTDRVCKYNELLRIEEMLGKKARFAGFSAIAR